MFLAAKRGDGVPFLCFPVERLEVRGSRLQRGFLGQNPPFGGPFAGSWRLSGPFLVEPSQLGLGQPADSASNDPAFFGGVVSPVAVGVGVGPEGDLEGEAFPPGGLDALGFVGVEVALLEDGLDVAEGFDEGDEVAQGDVVGGVGVVGLVFLGSVVAFADFVLVVEPVVVVGAVAGVVDPLGDAFFGAFEVGLVEGPVGGEGLEEDVAGGFRPVVDEFLGVGGEEDAGAFEVFFVLLGEAEAFFEAVEFVVRDGAFGDVGVAVRVPGDGGHGEASGRR